MSTTQLLAVAIARRRLRQRGWRVVVGAFGVMFVTFGIINSFSPFFAPLQQAFTAQRGAIALRSGPRDVDGSGRRTRAD